MSLSFSAGGVVLNVFGKVLVVSQKGGSWSLPKGHINDGEDAMAAALREIEEEAGLKGLDWQSNLGSYRRFKIGTDGADDPSEEKDITMFLFHTSQMSLAPQDPDNQEALWLDPAEAVARLTHPMDRQFLASVMLRIERARGRG
jgi:8-oxo-dGTP diphosphatase